MIRLIQKHITDRDLRPHLDAAADAGVDLVCFGELAATGCLYTPREAPTLEVYRQLCHKYQFGVMFGTALTTERGLENVYLYFRGSECRVYSKINLFPGMGEPDVYAPGSEPAVWDTGLGKTGVTICYDLRFPELYERLTKAGATTILVPAAFPRVRIGDWKSLLVQRAKDNRVRLIGINAVGNDGTNEFGGSTTVVEPDGSIRFQLDETSPMTVDFEPSLFT
jgi:omega-amidase